MMQLRMYERVYLGVDLSKLPASSMNRTHPAGPEVYEQVYGRFEAEGGVSPDWIANKHSFGRLLLDKIIQPWSRRTGRSPRVLSVGAGLGFIEEPWLQAGMDVTLHDGKFDPLAEIVARHPSCKWQVGDLMEFVDGHK